METRRWLGVLALCGGVALGACEAPVASLSAAPDAPTTRAQALVGAREVVLHPSAQAEGRLGGTIEPVRANTDALRVVTLDARAEALGLPAGARVLDARRVPGGVVALGADRVLRLYAGGQVKTLDTEALGPISAEAGRVAYVRGEAPDLALRVMSLREGMPHSVTEAPMPAWSPALSADGQEVIFVATHEGQPHLFRAPWGGVAQPIPTGTRTPSSPVAPIWRGDTLTFEDEQGVVRWNLKEATIEAQRPGARLVPSDGSATVRVMIDGLERPFDAEVAR